MTGRTSAQSISGRLGLRQAGGGNRTRALTRGGSSGSASRAPLGHWQQPAQSSARVAIAASRSCGRPPPPASSRTSAGAVIKVSEARSSRAAHRRRPAGVGPVAITTAASAACAFSPMYASQRPPAANGAKAKLPVDWTASPNRVLLRCSAIKSSYFLQMPISNGQSARLMADLGPESRVRTPICGLAPFRPTAGRGLSARPDRITAGRGRWAPGATRPRRLRVNLQRTRSPATYSILALKAQP